MRTDAPVDHPRVPPPHLGARPQRIWFLQMEGVVRRGFMAPLQEEDMVRMEDMGTADLFAEFDSLWAAEQAAKRAEGKPASMVGPLFRFKRKAILLTGALYLVSQISTFVGPFMLFRIVSALECRAKFGAGGAGELQEGLIDVQCTSMHHLYLYALGLIAAPLLNAHTESHQMFQLLKMGTQMRNALMAAVYRKCLKLDNAAVQKQTTGKIVTLMSNDCQKLQEVAMTIHSLWGSPVLIVGIIIYLYFVIEWAAIIGFLVTFMMGPLTAVLAIRLAKLRRELLPYVDKRVGIVTEVIKGIRVIKYYAWEKSFRERIVEVREKEGNVLVGLAVASSWFSVSLFAGPVFVAFISFSCYALAGNTIDVPQAYTALALFTMLRFPLSFLPQFVAQATAALVSLNRIQEFLSETELPALEGEAAAGPGDVAISRATLGWTVRESVEKPKVEAPPPADAAPAAKKAPKKTKKAKKAPEPEAPLVFKEVLKDVDFRAPPGKLTAIFGTVGSGKSTFISAVLQQATVRGGRVALGGRVAYTAQEAWIKNDKFANNITYGSEYDQDKYEHVLDICQLKPDVRILPKGDQTEIGERGVNLSGGQKQRIAIARAVYADADVYLLDDPLSALDAHVGRSIFEDVFTGELKGKTVLLVTNALHFLPQADNIVWIQDGALKYQGDYEGLLSSGIDTEMLINAGGEEAADSAEERDGGRRADTKDAAGEDIGRAKDLTGIEDREKGAIASEVYKLFVTSSGGWSKATLVIVLYMLEMALRAGTDAWIGVWTSGQGDYPLWVYLTTYLALGIAFSIVCGVRAYALLLRFVVAALSLHHQLLDHVLQLPIMFFDTNPSGRIVNRFSRDMEIIDSVLSTSMIQFLSCVANVLITVAIISVAAATSSIPYLLAVWVPVIAIYYFVQRYYIPTAREVQRIESVTRSPIYAHFGETVAGVNSIRAFQREADFVRMSDQLMDANSNAYITQRLAAAWLSMRLDAIGMIIVGMAGFLAVSGSMDVVFAGLMLTYSIEVTKFLKFGTQLASKVESDFNSVERVQQYLTPPTEGARDTAPEVAAALPSPFPAANAIEFKDFTMRYRPGLPLVLKGLSFAVRENEKVGIVGRTGSGKSSLIVALYRLVERTSGAILIDGVDIATLGLDQLRGAMSMIPQDPFLFSGTIRQNIDPFDDVEDDQKIWEALEMVGLRGVVAETEQGLGSEVSDNGSNFSQGQRQLFCMARALLKNSKILMLDEATASIDLETDAAIQKTIRTAFKDCTVLTIAHRLDTIMDSDRILVMDGGHVAEFDVPKVLLDDKDGILNALVNSTGEASSRSLRRQATSSYDNLESLDTRKFLP